METFVLRPGLRVAVIGHTGHGKTALIAALTRHVASKPYGARTVPVAPLTDDASTAHRPSLPDRLPTSLIESPSREYTAVDVLGRRRFLRHAGVMTSCVDACVLVVSASQGVMPLTRAHCILAKQHSRGAAVVFINRCDEVTDLDQLDLAEMEAREALVDAGFDGDSVLIVRGSAAPPASQQALWSGALDDLIDALDRGLSDSRGAADAPLVATVMHRWRRPARPAVVVEFSVRQGAIRKGERAFVLDRYGLTRAARVVSLRVLDKPVDVVEAGMIGTAALNVEGDRAPGWRRFPRMGDTIFGAQAKLKQSIRVRLAMLSTKAGGRRTAAPHGHEAQLWLLGRDVRCRMLLDDPMRRVEPGEECELVLSLAAPVAVEAGATFAMRDGSDGDAVSAGPGVNQRVACFATGVVLSTLD